MTFTKEFPGGGCCYNVVTLAARFLHDHHGIAQERIQGAMNASAPHGGHHSWLIVDGLTCDITADQFPDFNGPVIGVKESKLHEFIFGQPEIWLYADTAYVCGEWKSENLDPVLLWIYEREQVISLG